MSIAIRKDTPSALELQYIELKKQALLDSAENQARLAKRERRTGNLQDDLVLSEARPAGNEPAGRKPSEPVTQEEMLALRRTFSVYV